MTSTSASSCSPGRPCSAASAVLDHVQTRPAPTSVSSTARPVTAERRPSQPKGAVSNSRRLMAAWSMPVASSRAASSWVSGRVLPNRKEPVSAASPAYRQVASWGSIETPSSSSRPATRVTVAGARPSISRTSPKPGLLAWWSTTTDVPARSRRTASSPSRPGEAASRLTNTSGDEGTDDEGTSPSAPGSQPSDAGRVNGSGNVVRTRAPRRRSPSASDRVLPRASASGWTCPERTTVARASAASASTPATVRCRDGTAAGRDERIVIGSGVRARVGDRRRVALLGTDPPPTG